MDNGLVPGYNIKNRGLNNKVLILVVVDNGLVHCQEVGLLKGDFVLILVVVDNGLVLRKDAGLAELTDVLILVVVDNGLVLNLIRHY